jgi:CPA2 family monovalent cation:H+ antiporter-2
LSIVVLYFCHHLRIPSIVGFLVTGLLCGPNGLGLVGTLHDVEALAEFGVILLLFTIGIEFSFDKLLQLRKSVLVGGTVQVFLTILAVFLLAQVFHQPYGRSVFLGFLISLSSTAIVLKMLQERSQVNGPPGQTILGILIFQDLIVVPMILFTPLLAGASGNVTATLFSLLLKAIAILVGVMILAKKVVPYVLHQIVLVRSRELFLLSIVGMCMAIAWVTSNLGLSLALGAFLAGLIISESEYSHQAFCSVLPFRDVFTSFFFVSIGMLLDVTFLIDKFAIVVLLTTAVLVLNSVISGLATLIQGYPLRVAIIVGLAVSQVGEFAFILSKLGVQHGLLTDYIYQLFLSVSVLTMALTPFLINYAPRLANFVSQRLPVSKWLKTGIYDRELNVSLAEAPAKTDHLVIVGYGLSGKNLARAAAAIPVDYAIIEMNPNTVREEQAKGEPIYYGDAAHPEVLHLVNIEHARVVVVAISDPAATVQITDLIRRMSPNAHIIVRARYLQDIEMLYGIGANEVIPEEFETSIEIISLVLKKYLVPHDEMDAFIAEIRADGYQMFRSLSKKSASLRDLKLHFHNLEIMAFKVGEKSLIAGKTLEEIDLRNKYGISVLLIRRADCEETLTNPKGTTRINGKDVVIVLGSPEKVAAAASKVFADLEITVIRPAAS